MHRRFEIVDYVAAAAIFLLPWQARWMYGYHLLNGQRYEYGTFSIYASSVILILAVILLFRQHKRDLRFGWPAWLLFAWLSATVLFQIDRDVGLHSLAILIIGFGYCIVAAYWRREYVLQTMIASGVLQALIAWCFFIAQHIPASTFLGVAEHSPAVLGQSVIIINGGRILRAYGLLPHPNILGGFLVIAFAYAVYAYCQRTKDMNAHYLWKKWAFELAASIFIFSGILITFSRAGLVAVALFLSGWAIYACLIQRRLFMVSVMRIASYALVLFMVFNAVAGNIWMQRLGILIFDPGSVNQEQERLEQISSEERIASYHQAAVLAEPEHVFRGVGLGGFVPTLARAFPDLDIFQYQPTHNALVMMVLEIGIVGALVYLWFLASLLKRPWFEHRHDIYWQLLFSAIFVVAFMGFFDHFLWTQYVGQSMWWLVVGVAANRGN